MLACKHCSTTNSLDSTFCKKCGTAIPADQRREAALQLDKLVDEGLAALNAGRTAEALAIASSAVASDPTHLGALQLKSAVHERRGEIADALESAERIVELNPDSELDRIKRNGLRNSLLSASTPVQPDRRVAFAAAAAAMILVACGGVLWGRSRNAEASVSSVASNVPTTNGIGTNADATGGTIVDNPVAVTQRPAVQAPLATTQTTVTTPEGTTATTTITPGVIRSEPVTPRVPSGIQPLPTTSGDDSGAGMFLSPVNPPTPTPTVPKTTPTVKSPTKQTGDPDPGTLAAETPKNDGSIEIEVSRRGARTGGSRIMPETRTNGSAAYAQVGTERFQLGDYAGAAVNLEKAVAGGGDAVQLNLRLAQAYTRLGRNSEAAAAYERTRSAAASALASGKGDKDRLQAARDTADAGLKTVKGG